LRGKGFVCFLAFTALSSLQTTPLLATAPSMLATVYRACNFDGLFVSCHCDPSNSLHCAFSNPRVCRDSGLRPSPGPASRGGPQRLAHTVGNSRGMELVLTGRMWSAPRQVRAARGEHRHDHERGGSQRPGRLAHDGARAHGAHVERSGGCCVGHGQDDEGFQGVDSDIII